MKRFDDASDLLRDSQFGFRNKRSSVLQILNLLDDMIKGFNCVKQTDSLTDIGIPQKIMFDDIY